MKLSRRNILTGTGALTLLSGCGALSALGQATTPLDAYELRPPRNLPQAGRMLSRSLSVELPSTSGALETDRIMIRPNAVQSLYLPGARWVDKSPNMLQTLMLRSFEDTGALAYVGRRPLGGSGDFALVTEITDFQAELVPESRTATTRIRMTARMVRESDARVLARRVFTANGPQAPIDPLPLVESFNAATDQLMEDVVRWGLSVMGLTLPVA